MSTTPSQDRRIRIVVAGLGNRALWAVRALASCADFELVALIDKHIALIEFFADEFGLGKIAGFASLEDCLNRMDVDAVAVFTPDGTHADLVIPSLQAGKWVYVDKPLEISNDRMRQIIDADDAAGGKTFVGLNLRFAPVYMKVRELIDSGVIGRVLTIQQDEFYDLGRTYFRRWNRLRKFGGGLWLTKACHDFDIMYWMAGATPLSVCANASLSYYTSKPEAAIHCRDCDLRDICPDAFDRTSRATELHGRFFKMVEIASGQKPDLCVYNSDKDTFDHGAALVTFAGGIVGTYTVNVVCGFENRRLRVSGTRGTIDAELTGSEVTILHRDPSRVQRVAVPTRQGAHGGADALILASFVQFVRHGAAGTVTPSEAAVGVQVGLAAQQSCDQSQVIHLQECTHTAPTARPAP